MEKRVKKSHEWLPHHRCLVPWVWLDLRELEPQISWGREIHSDETADGLDGGFRGAIKQELLARKTA